MRRGYPDTKRPQSMDVGISEGSRKGLNRVQNNSTKYLNVAGYIREIWQHFEQALNSYDHYHSDKGLFHAFEAMSNLSRLRGSCMIRITLGCQDNAEVN